MKVARIAGVIAAVCVAVLVADYIVATVRTPADVRHMVRPPAEEKRITAERQARKTRDNAVAWVLIAAASLFFIYAPGRRKRLPHQVPRTLKVGQALSPARNVRTPRTAPPIDLTFVDDLVARVGRNKESAITLLQAVQQHYRYLPDEALRRLCELTEITPAQIAGTSSFYGQFRQKPVGKHVVRVCHGTACHVSGARQISDEVRRYLAIPEGEDTDAARMFTVEEVACLGCCSLAPVLMVDNQTAGRLTPATATTALAPIEEKEPA
jgi:NADH:ubiquinone oxidoreductase subunit E